jgi:hypothetical protein
MSILSAIFVVGNVDLYLLERVLPLLFGIADFIKLLRVVPVARFTDLSLTGCGAIPPAVFRSRRPQFGKWPPMGVRDGPSSGSGIGELKKSAPGPPPVVL